MQARYESAKIDPENMVDFIGVSFSKDNEQSGILANQIIVSIAGAFSRVVHFTVLPTMAIARIDLPDSLSSIGGLPFMRLNAKLSEDWLDAVKGEEVLMLLAETERVPDITSTVKVGNLWKKLRQMINLDPYLAFKTAAIDGKTITAFYSASHQDLEIYLPRTFKHQVFELLKDVGVRGLPESN
mgnify:CR=1 FL=1